MDRNESGEQAGEKSNDAGRANPFRIDTDDERRFREDVRSWIADALPDDLRGLVLRPDHARLLVWQRLLHGRGRIDGCVRWHAPTNRNGG